MSNDIVLHAKRREWEQMRQLDLQRMQLLESLFSDKDFDAEEAGVKERIQHMVILNEQALEICAQAREVVMADSRKLKTGRDALSAYKAQYPE